MKSTHEELLAENEQLRKTIDRYAAKEQELFDQISRQSVEYTRLVNLEARAQSLLDRVEMSWKPLMFTGNVILDLQRVLQKD